MELLLLSLTACLVCMGIAIASRKGNILYNLKELCKKLPEVVYNPTFGCAYCMASFWTIVTRAFTGFGIPFYELLIAIPVTCALNFIAYTYFPHLEEDGLE